MSRRRASRLPFCRTSACPGSNATKRGRGWRRCREACRTKNAGDCGRGRGRGACSRSRTIAHLRGRAPIKAAGTRRRLAQGSARGSHRAGAARNLSGRKDENRGDMNPLQMMKQAQQLQERLQKEMSALTVEGMAGGGMVTVVVNGHKHVQKLTID